MGSKHLPTDTVELYFRVPREQAEALKARAKEEGTTLAALLRTLVGGDASAEVISLDEIRALGVQSLNEYRRRLSSGKPLGDTALSKNIERLATILEQEEERRAHGGFDPGVVEAVFQKTLQQYDGFLGFLKDIWEREQMPRERMVELAPDYLSKCEAHTAKTRVFVDEVSEAA
jgi:hypothetical protein